MGGKKKKAKGGIVSPEKPFAGTHRCAAAAPEVRGPQNPCLRSWDPGGGSRNAGSKSCHKRQLSLRRAKERLPPPLPTIYAFIILT